MLLCVYFFRYPMKKILFLISLFFVSFWYHFSYADEPIKITIENVASNSFDTTEVQDEKSLIKRAEFFEYIAQIFSKNILPSYQYIDLKFSDVKKWTPLYNTLQKLVYLDIIPNKEGKIYAEKPINAYKFFQYAGELLSISFNSFDEENTILLKSRNANLGDFKKLKEANQNNSNQKDPLLNFEENTGTSEKKEIFIDVYKTLKENHYNKDSLSESEMMYQAIQGLAKGTWDKFTSFFPPMENKSFQDSLTGKYQWIGAYVDMESPWVLKIISPIPWSPAEKSGLKWGDIIVKVDEKDVTKEKSLYEVISWIKGPANTKVVLSIKRGEAEIFKVEVTRSDIIIKEVEGKKYDSTTYYVQIKQFWDSVFEDFNTTLEEIKKDKNIKKIILDLRNNPGWYLDQVNEMLSLFIQKWDVVSSVKYTDFTISNKSKGYDVIDVSKYKIILLQNSWTASASEIMIGTLKDYFSDMVIVGETSYGKWSVQTIKEYQDGSSLKFTIAKWFTGKTQIGIDGIGIKPDIEVKLDEEKYKKGIDNQFEKALEIK